MPSAVVVTGLPTGPIWAWLVVPSSKVITIGCAPAATLIFPATKSAAVIGRKFMS